jgi:hypothetical protein
MNMVDKMTNTNACTIPTKISIKYIGDVTQPKNIGSKRGGAPRTPARD